MGYCICAGMNEANRIYHDTEWGIPVHDDRHKFEYLTLERLQSNAIQFMPCVRYGDRWYNRTPMSILAMIAGTETYSGGLVWQ